MGSIVERARVDKDGKHYVDFRAFIRRKGFKSKSKVFRSKREAQRWLRDNEAAATMVKIPTGKTFTALLDDFVDLSGCSYARHSQLEFWRNQFHGRAVADITHGDIAGARLALQRKRVTRGGVETDKLLTNSTINRFLSTLSAVFSFAVDHGVIDTHPMKGGRVKKLTENLGRQRVLTDDEAARLLTAAEASEWPMLRLFLRVLMTTGARRSEVNGLRWSDLRLEDKVAILPRTKNGEPRALPLVGDVRAELAAAYERRPEDSDFIFYDPRNPKRAKTVDAAWLACRKAAGLDGEGIVLHSLRHTAVTKLVKSGANLSQVARVSGHKTLAMLKRYEHLAVQDAVELAEKHLAGYVTGEGEK